MGEATLLERPQPGDPSPPPPGRGSGRGDDSGQGGRGGRGDSSLAVLGMWLALVPILVLFLTLCTAYVLRLRGPTSDLGVALPRLLWLNTVVLLGSSVCLEAGRRAQRQLRSGARWFLTAFGLGVLFLLGQLTAWLVWWKSGMGPSATPHSAFFYILTATHGAHVLAGMLLLGVIAFRPDRLLFGMRPAVQSHVVAIYWHFLGALWVGLLTLLERWR